MGYDAMAVIAHIGWTMAYLAPGIYMTCFEVCILRMTKGNGTFVSVSDRHRP